MENVEIEALRSEVARLESANDMLTTRLDRLDLALTELGFPRGLDSLVESLQALFNGPSGDRDLEYGEVDRDNPPLA